VPSRRAGRRTAASSVAPMACYGGALCPSIESSPRTATTSTHPVRRSGAAAGAVAAVVWAASEPLARRLCRTSYSDVRLLGRAVTRGRLWPAAGLALHVANGAVFGTAFERAGLRGWRAGVLAAEIENLVLWPGMAVVDRFHPDRRSGSWPPLLANGRVFAQEAFVHAVFGATLGALIEVKG
jgi:hypothetical protein